MWQVLSTNNSLIIMGVPLTIEVLKQPFEVFYVNLQLKKEVKGHNCSRNLKYSATIKRDRKRYRNLEKNNQFRSFGIRSFLFNVFRGKISHEKRILRFSTSNIYSSSLDSMFFWIFIKLQFFPFFFQPLPTFVSYQSFLIIIKLPEVFCKKILRACELGLKDKLDNFSLF